ncbi:MAG: V-type ATPase subunit [Candidatus Aenigmarchaeota archaeon]|nr:V-type ATPase subunit [Candidatus Aenigmarchaeota archaeon]
MVFTDADYPYTATRAKVMRSRLLKKGDYERLEKVQLFEMIQGLSSFGYDATELSKEYNGLELLNLALNRGLASTVQKLLKIAIDPELAEVIGSYSKKWIAVNIKTGLRARAYNLPEKDIKYACIPVGGYGQEFARQLVSAPADSIVRMIGKILPVDKAKLREALEKKDMTAAENEVEKAYYSHLLVLSKGLAEGMQPIRAFLNQVIMLVNIRNAFKFRLAGMDARQAAGLMAGDDRLPLEILNADSPKAAIEALKASKYRQFAEGIESDISRLEINIEKYLLVYTSGLVKEEPLSIFPVINFLLAKEAEIRNLRLYGAWKAGLLDEKFVRENVVVV